MTSKCELFLYLAARAQHVEEKIIPELEKNNIVLSDRFEEATFAYQGAGRGFDTYVIRSINSYATSNIIPDLTFIFDISPEESEKRSIASGKIKDRMELNDIEFFKKIRNSYRFQSELSPERIILIDGSQSIKSITDEVFCRILPSLLRKNIEPI
jgi:dTMP kinase